MSDDAASKALRGAFNHLLRQGKPGAVVSSFPAAPARPAPTHAGCGSNQQPVRQVPTTLAEVFGAVFKNPDNYVAGGKFGPGTE